MNAFFQTLGLAYASAVLSLQMTGQVTITQPYTTAEEYVQEILLGEGVTNPFAQQRIREEYTSGPKKMWIGLRHH